MRCPFECDVVPATGIERGMLAAHLAKCPKMSVRCSVGGCTAMVLRQDLPAHVETCSRRFSFWLPSPFYTAIPTPPAVAMAALRQQCRKTRALRAILFSIAERS